MKRLFGAVVVFLLLAGLLGTAVFSYHTISAANNQILAAVPAVSHGHVKGNLGSFSCSPDPNDNPSPGTNDDTAAGANILTPSPNGNAFNPATSWNDTVCTPASTANDTDWFTFNVTTGTNYSVGLSASGAYTPTLQIAGPGTSQPNGGYTGSLISFSFTANANGTVIISVNNAGGPSGTGDPSYQYTIGAAQTPPTPTPTATGIPTITSTPTTTPTPLPSCTVDSFEPDDYLIGYRLTSTPPPSGNELFVDGSAQSHTIYTSTVGHYDVDWAYFYANTGKPFNLSTSNLGGGLDTYMELWDDSGNKIASNDDNPAGNTLASFISFTPSYTGRYWVMVRDTTRRNSCGFNYNLSLSSSGVPTPTPTGIPSATTTVTPTVCADAYDPSGVPAKAHDILIGEVQDHIFCPAGEADWVKFFALAGKQYTVNTQNLGIGVDTKLYLFDTDGTTLITYNDDFGGTLASQVVLIPQVDGIYYVQAKNAGDIGGPTQTYQLKLTAGAITTPATPTTIPTTTGGSTPTPTTGTGTTSTPTTGGAATPTVGGNDTPTPTPTTFLQATDTPVPPTPTSGPASTDTPTVPPENTAVPPTNTVVPTPTPKYPGLPPTGGGGSQ